MTLRKLKYRPESHAIDRLLEFFGVKEIHAADFINDVMKSAEHVTTQTDGRRLFKNDGFPAMLVVAKDNGIVTVLPSPEIRRKVKRTGTPVTTWVTARGNLKVTTVKTVENSPNNAIITAARVTIQRELTKARRIFTREYRTLKLEIAELGVEIAQASVNLVRCKHPGTQTIIQRKIDELQANSENLNEVLADKQSEYDRMRREAAEFIGIEA